MQNDRTSHAPLYRYSNVHSHDLIYIGRQDDGDVALPTSVDQNIVPTRIRCAGSTFDVHNEHVLYIIQ